MGIFGEVVYYMFGGASACASWISSSMTGSSSPSSSYISKSPTLHSSEPHSPDLHVPELHSAIDTHQETLRFNPANGLPMIGGIAGIDILSNPYGTDSHAMGTIDSFHDPLGIDSCFDSGIHDPFDSLSGVGSGIHDPFSSGCGMDNW